jgi:hypothetical protein
VDLRQEPISPELALVDPVLAEAARAALPEEPWRAFIPAPAPVVEPEPAPPTPVEVPLAEAPPRWPEEPAPAPAPPRRRRSRRLVMTAAFAAAAAAGVAVGGDFIGPRAADRPSFAPDSIAVGTSGTTTAEASPSPTVGPPVNPAAPSATTTEEQPAATTTAAMATKPKQAAKPKPAAKPSKSRSSFVPARVFAWGPVQGATTYRVRFYRGQRLVLQRTTKTARIELPRSFAFAKGRYRWVVEAKVGAKYGNAVVDSKFTIP